MSFKLQLDIFVLDRPLILQSISFPHTKAADLLRDKLSIISRDNPPRKFRKDLLGNSLKYSLLCFGSEQNIDFVGYWIGYDLFWEKLKLCFF